MNWFLHSNSMSVKLARTLVEVVLGWALTYIPDMLNLVNMSPEVRGAVASLFTLVITAILGFINDNKEGQA